jgi:hypothetical protein
MVNYAFEHCNSLLIHPTNFHEKLEKWRARTHARTHTHTARADIPDILFDLLDALKCYDMLLKYTYIY